jgi:hypothetical protein
MIHGASVCLQSGGPWVDAFVRSRIGKSWEFLPSQLGLPLHRHSAWNLQRLMMRRGRVHTDLPSLPALEHRYELREVVDDDEKIAFSYDLFNGGREVDDRRLVVNRTSLRRSFRWFFPKVVRLSCGRLFDGRLTAKPFDPRPPLPVVKRTLYCVPLSYDQSFKATSPARRNGDGDLCVTNPTCWW